MSGRSSLCNKILQTLDFFSYLPVPHTYPVSSTKSKSASLIIIILLLTYFIYDFVMFITNNTPIVNGYVQSLPDSQQYNMPNIAFGFIYGQELNKTLNDPGYFQFQFYTIKSQIIDGQIVTSKQKQELISNCQPKWMNQYNNFYQNLTCLKENLKLKNPPLKRPEYIIQRLSVSLCEPSNPSSKCIEGDQLTRMISGGRIFFFINEPQGFNFNSGKVSQSQYPFSIFQFFLIPSIYNRINIQFQPSNFIVYPTYLTSFTQSITQYIKSTESVSLISNVTIYNKQLMLGITLGLSDTLNIFQIHFKTVIEVVSMWGALTNVLVIGIGLCCLAYNKRKFLNRNPGWGQFDRSLNKKFQMEMTAKQKKDENQGAIVISDIRRQIQLQQI